MNNAKNNQCFLSKQITSPLRYPGGKNLLASYFYYLLEKNDLNGCRYYEPFAGGAGVGLRLLFSESVSEIILNDADYHIYCFWRAATRHSEKFVEHIRSVPLTIEEWHRQKEIYRTPKKHGIFQVGFSTFFLNRCNRSGIIKGAAPIGGYEQKGPWNLAARFNKQTLIERISRIGLYKDRITFKNMDAIDFLRESLPRGNGRSRVLVYCDPPYIKAGNRLYLNYYEKKDHEKLAKYLLGQNSLNWIVSYDDDPLIRNIYRYCQKWIFSLGYSLQKNHQGKELLIAPDHVKLPGNRAMLSAKCSLIRKIKSQAKPREVLV